MQRPSPQRTVRLDWLPLPLAAVDSLQRTTWSFGEKPWNMLPRFTKSPFHSPLLSPLSRQVQCPNSQKSECTQNTIFSTVCNSGIQTLMNSPAATSSGGRSTDTSCRQRLLLVAAVPGSAPLSSLRPGPREKERQYPLVAKPVLHGISGSARFFPSPTEHKDVAVSSSLPATLLWHTPHRTAAEERHLSATHMTVTLFTAHEF